MVRKIKYQKIPICAMSGYSSLNCGDIFSSTKNTNLFTTQPCPCPNIAGGMAVEMVIPLQAGLEKLPTQFFWVLVEQNSCRTSAKNNCVAPQCRHQAVNILQHSLRCGIPLGKGRSVVYLKKYENVHLLGMVLCLVWRISVSHLGRKCYRTLHALAPTLPEGSTITWRHHSH